MAVCGWRRVGRPTMTRRGVQDMVQGRDPALGTEARRIFGTAKISTEVAPNSAIR
jgi:hypothetical protein